MNKLLLFSEDATLHAEVATLSDYEVILPDGSAWQEQFFDLVILDISAFNMTDTLIIHIGLVTNYILVVGNAQDQAQFQDIEIAFDYMLKPITLYRLEKRLDAINLHRQEIARYLSHMRHELRNPLASIAGYTDLLLSALEDPTLRANVGDLTEKQVKFLESIRRASGIMQEKIEELSLQRRS